MLLLVFRGVAPGVASGVWVREVADPKCWCAGVSRPRWIVETPALPSRTRIILLKDVSALLVGEQLAVVGVGDPAP